MLAKYGRICLEQGRGSLTASASPLSTSISNVTLLEKLGIYRSPEIVHFFRNSPSRDSSTLLRNLSEICRVTLCLC